MTYGRIYVEEEDELKVITCNLPKKHLHYIRQLLKWGLVPSRSEYIRKAVAEQIKNDFETKRYVDEVIEATDENTIKIPGRGEVTILRRLE